MGILKNGLVCSGRKLLRGDDGCVGWDIRNVMYVFCGLLGTTLFEEKTSSRLVVGLFGMKYGLMIRLPFHESIFSAGISPDFRTLS